MGMNTQAEFLLAMTDQGFHLPLILAIIDNLGAHKVSYTTNKDLPSKAIFLVSGSISFVKNWNRLVENPMLVLCDKHVRNRRTRYGSTLCWTQLRHDTFGGVTHFQAMLGSNIPGFEPDKTNLRRTIRHVLDYSLKPKWAPLPALGAKSTSLTLNNRIHPSELTSTILYHTHYSATGWGISPVVN
jgi:hypothetical protein